VPSSPAADRIVVSVVIPAKDDARQLETCLAALDRQTRRADEVVVVDNGSSDETASVAAAAGARVVWCPEPGIPAATAAGFDTARGEMLLRLDADCVPGPRWIERMVAAFEEAPHAAAVTGGARFVDGPKILRAPLAALYLVAYAAATIPALGHLPLFGSNFALRAAAWRAVRPAVHRHDSEVHDDLDLAFHLGEHHRVAYRSGLTMGMSMRPFHSASSLRTRLRRGVHTVTTHWPRDFPPRRWLRRAVNLRMSRLPVVPTGRAATASSPATGRGAS
jgi:glycosyltransferase involved in cell wall biosynthesis